MINVAKIKYCKYIYGIEALAETVCRNSTIVSSGLCVVYNLKCAHNACDHFEISKYTCIRQKILQLQHLLQFVLKV